MSLAIIAVCLFTPLLILWLTYRFPILNKVGTIIIAYVIGCLLGLTGLIPDTPEVHKVQTDIATYTIPFAIPLLLFSSDLKSWLKLAPSFIKSTLLGIAGCCIAIVIGFLVCAGDDRETFASIGGMLTGLYTGLRLTAPCSAPYTSSSSSSSASACCASCCPTSPRTRWLQMTPWR